MLMFRLVYFAAVVIGLLVNSGEYLHARWVYGELVRRKINGDRQMLARSFRGEELTRVWVQAILMLPAVIGLLMPRDLLTNLPLGYRGLAAVSVSAHIAVAVLLAVKALNHRAARHEVLERAGDHEGAHE